MYYDLLEKLIKDSDLVLKGKKKEIKLVLCNIIAKGHTLIEDTPGVGKTTLVKFYAKALDLKISRIQFTNDLLPADILGTQIFDKNSNEFQFHKGPLFGELILADELNRAPPKTQSALLQAMQERQVNIEGKLFDLPSNFTVIATQNPNSQVGTYTLPESQLDRFSLKLEMGYPDKSSTIELLKSPNSSENLQKIQAVLNSSKIIEIQEKVSHINIDHNIYELIYQLIDISRNHSKYISLSNRCAIDLVHLASAWAFLSKRDYVLPDDVFYVFPYCAGHRLVHPESSNIETEHRIAKMILDSTSQ